MDVNGVLSIILTIVFIGVGVALVLFLVQLIKVLKVVNTTVTDVKKQLDPTLENVAAITTDIKPAVAKVDPMVDRLQLTVDTVNLEMMRVDGILENVGEITQTASSAVGAVDNITNAPLKAVNSLVNKAKAAFGDQGASHESENLAKQRVAVGQALQDYKAAENKEAKDEQFQAKVESDEKKAQAAAKDIEEKTAEQKGYFTATEGYTAATEGYTESRKQGEPFSAEPSSTK